MTAVLLSVHVLAAIVLIGPVTAAASLFPRYGREALAARTPGDDTLGAQSEESEESEDRAGNGSVAVLRALHRISSGYALVAVVVPLFGVATAARMGVLTQAWLLISIALTLVAALALGLLIVPRQREVLARLEHLTGGAEVAGDLPDVLRRLAMTTGLFALTWAVVVVLMILRPGSTTGV